MVAHTHAPELAGFPPELIAAIKAQAESEADAVGAFLRESGLHPRGRSPDEPSSFPLEYLVGIGLGIRLRRWQQANIVAHINAGLPLAKELFSRIGELVRGAPLRGLVARVFMTLGPVIQTSFLWWVDDDDSRIEMEIVTGDKEQVLEAVADYLWQQIQHNFGREG